MIFLVISFALFFSLSTTEDQMYATFTFLYDFCINRLGGPCCVSNHLTCSEEKKSKQAMCRIIKNMLIIQFPSSTLIPSLPHLFFNLALNKINCNNMKQLKEEEGTPALDWWMANNSETSKLRKILHMFWTTMPMCHKQHKQGKEFYMWKGRMFEGHQNDCPL